MLTLSGILFNLLSRRGSSSTTSIVRKSSTSSSADSNMEKAVVMFVLGGPGAGKGTQCINLVEVTFELYLFVFFFYYAQ